MTMILRLLPFLKPYWLRAVEAGVCMVFTTVLALPMPLLSVYIIDHVIANGQMQTLHIVCGALALAVMLGLGLGFLQRLLLLIFTRRVFFDLVHRGKRSCAYQFDLRLSLRHGFSRNPEGFKSSVCISDGNLYAERLTPRCTSYAF